MEIGKVCKQADLTVGCNGRIHRRHKAFVIVVVEFAAQRKPEDCVSAFFKARYHDAVGLGFDEKDGEAAYLLTRKIFRLSRY